MEDRFWIMDYSTTDHEEDLANAVKDGKIVCVVDEEAGGIVAYAVGETNALAVRAGLQGLCG